MAKRIRAKLVLELLARGMSGREIRSTRHISHRSIKLVRDAADRAGVTWDDVAENVRRRTLPEYRLSENGMGTGSPSRSMFSTTSFTKSTSKSTLPRIASGWFPPSQGSDGSSATVARRPPSSLD